MEKSSKIDNFETFTNKMNETVSTEDKYKVAEKLDACYKDAVNEAQEWADDVHDDHTIESYMVENAALVAALAARALKESNDKYNREQFEAAINSMKDAYIKKLNEVLDMEDGVDVE